MAIAYLVHDLNDPAVRRRMRMLQASGRPVRLVGFVRNRIETPTIEGAPYRVLGETAGGRLARRIGSVVSAGLRVFSWGRELRGAEVVVARNLEMLLLAAFAKALLGLKTRLVYECLDIHRLMVSEGAAGALLRGLERRLLAGCSLLVVSSRAFVDNYFQPRHGYAGDVLLIENKLLDTEAFDPPGAATVPTGPPWAMGWFGVLRCARSLRLLEEIAGRSGARVIMRGRPTDELAPLIAAACARNPNLTFGGPYDRRRELGAMYAGVHFIWAIDFYEDGANSVWLLPNRIYEGGFYNVPALALAEVETGRWLARHGLGVVAPQPLEETLGAALAGMTSERYAGLRQGSLSADRALFVYSQAECRRLSARILGAGEGETAALDAAEQAPSAS